MHLVPLVRERGPGRGVVLPDRRLAVEDLAGRDQLVAGMRERGERRLEVLAVLGVHVVADDLLAPAAEIRAHPCSRGRCPCIPTSRATNTARYICPATASRIASARACGLTGTTS